ncbi:glycosyltransferase [Amycolatopsis sp. NPDC059021]|uniref:glycosyltransferase n=1 Tax=Amycolatopsis sp. NPDC059021 TaxID=3346704 RepID=UPI00366D9159
MSDSLADPRAVAAVMSRLEGMAEVADRTGRRPYHKLLGPDIFGFGRTPEGPEFMRAVNLGGLSAAQGMVLLARLNLTRVFPAVEALTPEALTPAEQDVLVSDWSEDDRKYWQRVGIEPGRLPAQRVTPNLLHTIWVGGPFSSQGTTGMRQQRFAESARVFGGQAVLWTDVPRDRVEAVLAGDRDDSLTGVREMVEWAQKNDIVLVNIDEVFNSASATPLDSFYRAELSKGTELGYAAASDILRMLIVYAFGGLYIDGDDAVRQPGGLRRVHETAGFGFGKKKVTVPREELFLNNSIIASAKGHPMHLVWFDMLKEHYDLTQLEVFPLVAAVAPREQAGAGQGLVRRHSVMHRTGPNLLVKLEQRLGVTGNPGVVGVEMDNALSWVTGSPTRPVRRRVEADDGEGTAELTARMVQMLVRQLRNRQGDLHLTGAAGLALRHATPDVVWAAALRFLASIPALRAEVRTVTPLRFVQGKVFSTGVPLDMASLVSIQPGEQGEFQGEYTFPAVMHDPGAGESDSPVTGWRASILNEVMLDLLTALRQRQAEARQFIARRRVESGDTAAPSAKRPRPSSPGTSVTKGGRSGTARTTNVERVPPRGGMPGTAGTEWISGHQVGPGLRVVTGGSFLTEEGKYDFMRVRLPLVLLVNPHGYELAYSWNCPAAVVATYNTIVHRRVFEAGPDDWGQDEEDLEQAFGGQFVDYDSFAEVTQLLLSLPSEAHAVLHYWSSDEVTSESYVSHYINVYRAPDGLVIFIDGQAGLPASLPAHATRFRLMMIPPARPGDEPISFLDDDALDEVHAVEPPDADSPGTEQ